jgi:hypothetical protein
MPAEPGGFGATVGVDRDYELAELAAELGDERRSVGGALDQNSNRPAPFAEKTNHVAQLNKIDLFAEFASCEILAFLLLS